MTDQPYSLREGAIAVHELFSSYLDAGFTREEALQLTIATLTGKIGG